MIVAMLLFNIFTRMLTSQWSWQCHYLVSLQGDLQSSDRGYAIIYFLYKEAYKPVIVAIRLFNIFTRKLTIHWSLLCYYLLSLQGRLPASDRGYAII